MCAYNLSAIFENDELKNFYAINKTVFYNAFKNWLKENCKNRNFQSLSQLLGNCEKKQKIFKHMKTFFYNRVYAFSSQSENNNDDITELFLALLAFDSLYQFLPKNYLCLLESKNPLLFYMPTLGVELDIPEGEFGLIKIDEGNLQLVKSNKMDSYFFLRNRVIDANLIVLNTDKNSLIYKEILAKLAHFEFLEKKYFDEFYLKCKEALSILLELAPDIQYQIQKIEYIIPMPYVGKEFTKSFTLSMLPHVIFLSDSETVIKLSENIMHETFHDELNIFMQYYELFHQEKILYFSPWRDDPRPIRGLIHAIYVFTGILYHYECAMRGNTALFNANKEFIEFRLININYELILAYHQLEVVSEELTLLGQKFLKKLYQIFLKSSKNIFYECPLGVIEHLNRWKKNNPEFSLYIPQNMISKIEYVE